MTSSDGPDRARLCPYSLPLGYGALYASSRHLGVTKRGTESRLGLKFLNVQWGRGHETGEIGLRNS